MSLTSNHVLRSKPNGRGRRALSSTLLGLASLLASCSGGGGGGGDDVSAQELRAQMAASVGDPARL
jgi:hypothetical protein